MNAVKIASPEIQEFEKKTQKNVLNNQKRSFDLSCSRTYQLVQSNSTTG